MDGKRAQEDLHIIQHLGNMELMELYGQIQGFYDVLGTFGDSTGIFYELLDDYESVVIEQVVKRFSVMVKLYENN